MQRAPRSDYKLIIAMFSAICVAAFVVWHVSYSQEIQQIKERAEAEKQLMVDRLLADLQRYQDLAVSLAEDPRLIGLKTDSPNQLANAFLVSASDKTGAEAIYYVNTDKQFLASSTPLRPQMMLQSDYFQRALTGALGTSFGFDKAFGKRVFQFAAPAFSASGKVRGAVVVLSDVEAVEASWRSVSMALLMMDPAGQVFLSNRSELLGLQLDLDACQLRSRDHVRYECDAKNDEVWTLFWGPYLPRQAVPLISSFARINMSALALSDVAPAREIALLQAGATALVFLLFCLALIWTLARREVLARANQMLEARVAERTEALTAVNTALKHEVSERVEAEGALRKAQADLVQAGKLSALGQMSAGISHELNQPLMAIQQFAQNAGAFLARGQTDRAQDNLSRITQLATRAARIIKNLRAFARNENEPSACVDVVQVLETTIELTASRAHSAGVKLFWTKPRQPVFVRAGEVRLGQVFVNLINNAVDAMSQQPLREIHIALTTGARPTVIIRDTGPGISDPEKIFEPFYSTKEVNDTDGMGLGLSISYGLVQSFGGNIRGENAEDGGAVFTVELDAWREGERAI